MKVGIGHLGGDFSSIVGKVTLKREPGQAAANVPSKGLVYLTDSWASDVNGWSRVKTLIHETGHIITHNQPGTMRYFMDKLQAQCINGSTNDGLPYCDEDQGVGSYKPGPYAGVPWDTSNGSNIHPMPGTHMPSSYAEVGNWEDYAETFLTVVLEAYVESGDQQFSQDATFLNNSRYHDIINRRDVMQAILSGAWR